MASRLKRDDVLDFPLEDEMGFAVPVSPSHSLKLLNSSMRTDGLRPLHQHLRHLKDMQEPGSPLNDLAKSLELIIGRFEGMNLFECVNRNPFHIDPGYEFDAEKDYLHDIKLMKHHLKCHKK